MGSCVSLLPPIALGWIVTILTARAVDHLVHRGVRIALWRLPDQPPRTVPLTRRSTAYVLASGVMATGLFALVFRIDGCSPAAPFWLAFCAFVFAAVFWPAIVLGLVLFVVAGEGPRPWR